MLHLSGYSVSLNDLQHFRQLDSITPGHPENFATPGVEVCTGPLGQVSTSLFSFFSSISLFIYLFILIGYFKCGWNSNC